MSTYKVAQDVEAEDKLIGPFGFRQFIYLIAVGVAGIGAYGLFTLFAPLVVIPLPIILFFGALALPLRKDQPMETYLAALVSFYVKPRKRLWQPDGINSVIEITAPKTTDENRVKSFSGIEADKRLTYLADLADTRGWAIRHSVAPTPATAAVSSMVGDAYNEAQTAPDVLDDDGGVAKSFESLIDKAEESRRTRMTAQMHQIQPTAQPDPSLANSTPPDSTDPNIRYNPYPNSIRQSVIQPLNGSDPGVVNTTNVAVASVAATTDNSTSDNTVSPDIINLANNNDLSVETLAREAHRIKAREEEVVISLR